MATVVENAPQMKLGEIVEDDPRLIKIAEEWQRLDDEKKRRAERTKELLAELEGYLEGRTDIERDAVFRIGPATLRKVWKEIEEEVVTRTRQGFSGWKYYKRVAKIKRNAPARRTRASADGEASTTPRTRRQRTADKVASEQEAFENGASQEPAVAVVE